MDKDMMDFREDMEALIWLYLNADKNTRFGIRYDLVRVCTKYLSTDDNGFIKPTPPAKMMLGVPKEGER